jgi:RNA polymerase sigma-B factor
VAPQDPFPTNHTLRAHGDTAPPRPSEERLLFARYRRDGDVGARDALVERYLPLARHFARRYTNSASYADDLEQVAAIGLLNAIDRFDPDRGVAFSSFAVPTIVGEVKRYFRDKGWAVRVPRDLQERALVVEQVGDELERELGRVATVQQVAERMAVTVEQVLEARIASWAHHGVSLDRPEGDEGDEGRTLGDQLGSTDPGFGRAEDSMTFERLLSMVDERQRTILALRFREDLTQREIAGRVGLSQMQVSRIIRQAIAQLHASLLAERRAAGQRFAPR